jgi:hypothetical protein
VGAELNCFDSGAQAATGGPVIGTEWSRPVSLPTGPTAPAVSIRGPRVAAALSGVGRFLWKNTVFGLLEGMTYHWDDEFGADGFLKEHAPSNPHTTIPHLQIHTTTGVIRGTSDARHDLAFVER